MDKQEQEYRWLEWAKELQFIAQAGLTYTKDPFDKERFERVREIAAEIMSLQGRLPLAQVKDLFCNETGFQTPKLDTRAAIFKDDKILLVEENDGTWSMPGGWVDVMETVKSNTVKEVKEEAGLDVEAVRVIALHDRNLHNQPPYAYMQGVCALRGKRRMFPSEYRNRRKRLFRVGRTASLVGGQEQLSTNRNVLCRPFGQGLAGGVRLKMRNL